jgi:hypothetical protein
VQEAHGKDRLAVLLLSVDPEYFPNDDSYKAKAREIYATKKVDWPNVFLVKGWSDAVRTFNAPGYGNILVDSRGIVRAVNVHGKDLEKLVRQVVGEKRDTPEHEKR